MYLAILFAALLASIIWGITPFLYKKINNKGLSFITSEILLLFTSVVSAVLFFIIVLFQQFYLKSNPIRILKNSFNNINWTIFILWIILAYICAPVLFYNLLNTSVVTFMIVLLSSLMPLVTAIVGHYYFDEQLSLFNLFGIFLVIAGLVIVQL